MTKTTMIKRFVSLLVAYVMLISVMPSALANHAQQFSDFPTGWSKPAMEAAVDNGLLVGIGGGKIGPQKNLTRAEMAAVMVRAFGATTYADVSMYSDLEQGAWYYNDVAKAVRMGALAGVGATEMAPEDYITREQVFSILSRILALSSNNAAALSKFKDAGSVSPWALNTVIPLVERGYVNGDNNGRLNPQAYITREEFAQLMYTTIKVYITEQGIYGEDLSGMVVLRTGNVTLKDMYIEGDLVVGDGAAKNLVNLENVTINGRLLTRGGTNTLKSTVVKYGVVVLNPNGTTVFRNYRTEDPFKGIIEYTVAAFLTNSGSTTGGTSSGGREKYDVVFKIFEDDTEAYHSVKITDGNKIGSRRMPADPVVSGYTFNGWVDEDGNPVTEDTIVTGDMTVVADLTPIVTPPPTPVTYTVTFKLFESDTEAYAEIEVEEGQEIGGQMPADPTVDGYKFNGWVDEDGNPVDENTEVTGPMTIIADLTQTITVKFWEGLSGRFATQIGEVVLELVNGEASVDASDIPDDVYYFDVVYKNDYMDLDYEDYDGSIRVIPSFYYYDGEGWKLFDENVVLTEDTDVSLFYKFIGVSGFETSVSAYYSDETRLVDSIITFSDDLAEQIFFADQNGLDIYEKINALVYGTLEDKDLINEDKFIKKINIPLPLSTALKERRIKNVIEDRIELLIGNPEELLKWPGVTESIANSTSVRTISNAIYATDIYKDVVDAIMDSKDFYVTEENIEIVKAINDELEKITFETVMQENTNEAAKKIVDLLGDFAGDIFDEGRERYCAELDKIIEDIENGRKTRVKTSSAFDLIFDAVGILENLYDKAQDKIENKLGEMGIYYNENPYLQYLVEHDIIDRLFEKDEDNAPEGYSAYKLREILDYAEYMVELEIAVNDALLWYGEELTEDEFNAIYDAVFGKIYAVSDKLDGILEDYYYNDELPEKVEKAITSVKKINDIFLKFEPKLKKLIGKYLNSGIHNDIANGTIDDNEKLQTAIDILIGTDDPVFTIDCVFDIFYRYDDKMQEKLQALLDTGKLNAAIDKFKNSSYGDKISHQAIDDIVEIIETVAEEGVEAYLVDTSSDITVIEKYKIEIDGNEFTLSRELVF